MLAAPQHFHGTMRGFPVAEPLPVRRVLRPVVLRDARETSNLTLDRYELMRAAQKGEGRIIQRLKPQ